MKPMQKAMVLAALILLPLIGGCTNYYRVSDPSSGKIYYTTEVKDKGTATQLVDAKTGAKVTIQNSEISKITKEEYETGRGQK